MRRLPLLLVLVLGAWLWKGSFFPQPRQLLWQTGEDRASIRSVEIQLWSAHGELLKREQLFFPYGPGPEIAESATLKEGNYLARVFVRREGRPSASQSAVDLAITGEESYALRLPE